MGSIEQNRRRNQIIAERAAEKADREIGAMLDTDAELWTYVIDVLERSRRTEVWSGHPGNVVAVVRAQKALRELRARGTQLPLW